ncbi:co-chaperone GroES [Sulfurimonas sp.]
MNFKPLGERVLVQRIQEKNTTASGIIIPDNAKEKPSQAKVVAVSKEVKNVNVDDTVVFSKYAGSELSLDGNEYLVLDVKEILGVIA